jgi:hypothetical protein
MSRVIRRPLGVLLKTCMARTKDVAGMNMFALAIGAYR